MKRLNEMYPNSAALVVGGFLAWSMFSALGQLGLTKAETVAVMEIDFAQWTDTKPMPNKQPETTKPKQVKPKAATRKRVAENKPKPEVKQKAISDKLPSEEAQTEASVQPVRDNEPPAESLPDTEPPTQEAFPAPVPIFQLSSMPRFVNKVEPRYPEVMRTIGREAQVKLEVLVDSNGMVRRVAVLESGGDAFDDAARSALMASVFIPGNVNGKPVPVLMRIPVSFRLN